jgi:ankyrin repeat protein
MNKNIIEKLNSAKFNQDICNEVFIELCKIGDLDNIRYMLTSKDFNVLPDFESVDNDGNDGLTSAAAHGHLNVVEYLLFNPELEKNDFFPPYIFDYLRIICDNGHFHIADFLLKNEVFDPEHVFAEVHYYDQTINSLTYYLIINCNIEPIYEVKEILDRSSELAEIFTRRDLNKELNAELGIAKENNKKPKL